MAHQYSSKRLALPGENGDPARGYGGGGVVLSGKDVAAGPADLRPQGDQGLDQYRGLDRHVQRAGDAGTGQRLLAGVLLAQRHQARHLDLGQVDLATAEVGLSDVRHPVGDRAAMSARGRSF